MTTATTHPESGQNAQDAREARALAEPPSGWFARVAAAPRAVVAVCASIAGLWAVIGSRVVFPYLSNNHDEAVYLLQSDALAHGKLFPRASLHPDAFLPWLSVQNGNDFVPKYAPVYSGMLATAKVVFTSERVALGAIAAGVIVVTYLLATELLEDRKQAALASVFMLLTPLFIVQSATFLPYSAGLLLLSSFALFLLRGVRTDSAKLLVAAGLVLGIAFFARPYDALVFSLPFAGYVFFHYRKQPRVLLSRVGWIALGLVPPAIAMAAFNVAATGAVLDSPFSLIDSRDTIGFGERSMDPANAAVQYTPGLGWTGLSRHVMLSAFWCFGGMVLVGLAIFYVSRQHWRGRIMWFASVAVVLPVGYLFFWGSYGAAVWGAPWYLGPYYYMPIFAPLIICGTGGFVLFLREYGTLARWTLVGMLVLSVFVTGQAMVKNWSYTQDDRRLYTAFSDTELHDAIVFLPAFYGPRVLHPYATKSNNWNATGDVIYAVDRGLGPNAAVAADFPDRKAYVVEITGRYRENPPDEGLTTTLQQLAPVRAKTIDLDVSFANPMNRPIVSVIVAANGIAKSYVIDKTSKPDKRERLSVRITTDDIKVTRGRSLETKVLPTPASVANEVSIRIMLANKARSNQLLFQRWGSASKGDTMTLFLPGETIDFFGIEPVQLTAR